MNKFVSLFTLLLFTASAFAEKGIVVTQKYTDANVKANVTVTWYVTESSCKMKMEFADGKVNSMSWFIPDFGTNQLLTYAEGEVPANAKKSYFAIPIAGIKAAKSAAASAFKIERTGETKTIGGFNCEKIMANSGSTITEMWVTKDFKASFYKASSFFANSYELNALSSGNIAGVPLESTTKDLNGKVINAYSFVSASNTSLSVTDFIVPAEYKLAATGKN